MILVRERQYVAKKEGFLLETSLAAQKRDCVPVQAACMQSLLLHASALLKWRTSCKPVDRWKSVTVMDANSF